MAVLADMLELGSIQGPLGVGRYAREKGVTGFWDWSAVKGYCGGLRFRKG